MAQIKQEHVFGADGIMTDGIMIYAKNGPQLTECIRVAPSYRNKGVYNDLAKDMAAAVVLLLDRGMTSHDLAALIAKSEG